LQKIRGIGNAERQSAFPFLKLSALFLSRTGCGIYSAAMPFRLARSAVWVFGVVAVILGARYCVGHYVDFPVYWHASRALLSGRRDLYDPSFVFGAVDRMNYRYPPLFLLLFLPLGLLPYGVAGYLWFAGKLAALAAALRMTGRLAGTGIENRARFWSIPLFLATPYLLQDFHFGYVHLFVIALTAAALYAFETGRERLSAASLALAITIKVFPAILLPYFAVRRRFRLVALTLIFLILFNLAGGSYFGFTKNLVLLAAWSRNLAGDRYFQELNTGVDYSLKGVLNRYLTHVPYETRPIDYDYPNINVAAWSVGAVAKLRLALTALALWVAGWAVLRRRTDKTREYRLLAYGTIACLLVLLPPAVNYHYFEILFLPGAAISAYLLRRPLEARTRAILALVVVACALTALTPLAPGRAVQREIQMYSPSFFAALALFAALVLALGTADNADQ
jgi:hypothetical protein